MACSYVCMNARVVRLDMRNAREILKEDLRMVCAPNSASSQATNAQVVIHMSAFMYACMNMYICIAYVAFVNATGYSVIYRPHN